jgi:DNA-binding MarR family transcriptional regulator
MAQRGGKDEALAALLLERIPATMRFIRSAMRTLASDDLTVPQFRVLAALSRAPSTVGMLAEHQGVSKSAMSRMVDALVKKQLIQPSREEKDRRQLWLTLTPKGKERFDEFHRFGQKVVASKLEALEDCNKAQLAESLEIMDRLFGGRA